MLVHRRYSSPTQLLDIMRGTPIASGSVGTNTGASPDLGDATTGAFANALAGDRVYVSGETPTYAILTWTDANNIILDAPIVAAHTTDAVWRIFRGGILPADIILGPLSDGSHSGAGTLIVEQTVFGV